MSGIHLKPDGKNKAIWKTASPRIMAQHFPNNRFRRHHGGSYVLVFPDNVRFGAGLFACPEGAWD
jgi:hypothetical protein